MLFFCIVITLDAVFGNVCDYLYAHSKSGDTYKIRYGLCESEAEVLIMGSSRASHHYNPRILSDSLQHSVYNIGIDGSGVILMYGFYRLITKRYIPKLIIYELTPAFDVYEYAGDSHNTRYLSPLKPYYKDSAVASVIDDVQPMERKKLLSGFYRYNTQFINLFRFYLRPEEQRADGFMPHKGIMIKKVGKIKEKSDNVLVIDSLKISYLQKFIKECKEKGTNLVFAISPSYGESSDESYKPAIDLSKKNGVLVLNYLCDSSIVNNPQLFKDSYHLNEIGANIYTKTIASKIKQIISVQQYE